MNKNKLEDMAKTKENAATFSYDQLLPSLPLPTLEKTLNKYLDSCRPFLSEIEFLNTQKIVENFQNGIGKHLHFYLSNKANKERNWLEHWWFQWAYLEFREPIVPFINTTGYVIGSEVCTELISRLKSLNINVQAMKAAVNAYFYNLFFLELRMEKYPVQSSRSQIFSMDQYRRFFSTCRIPQLDEDKLVTHFRTYKEGQCPTHFLIIYRHRFFKIESFYKNTTNVLLNIRELYHIINALIEKYSTKSCGVGIGALTADNRDDWAKNRKYLIDLDAKNEQSFEQIEQALYVINLDDDETTNLKQITELSFLKNPKNRYSDKSYQLIICKNGNLGSNVEHSPFDGMVSTTATVYVLNKEKEMQFDYATVNSRFELRPDLNEPQEIVFNYDLKIENEIEKASKLHLSHASNIEIDTLILANCDKNTLKSYKINPDTFSQMCMQLAYYQLHNKPAPTYETATTRSYYNGRTETVRSCSMEAVEWCRAMCNKDSKTRLNNSELLSLLKRACQKHDQLMNEARNNAGCDRHLLGLMLTTRELKLDTPELFNDLAWKKSGGGGNFLISSSCVGYSNVLGVCCPFCTNGYTMIYCFSDRGLAYSVARYKNSAETSLEKICQSLKLASIQMQQLFESNSKI